MKKNTTTSGKRPFARIILSTLLAAGAFNAQAQTPSATPAAEITYAGTFHDRLMFDVTLQNETEQPFTLEIRDGEGFVFFSNRFSDKTFRKLFALDRTELERGTITIQVRTRGRVQTQTFAVDTKQVDEVRVEKL